MMLFKKKFVFLVFLASISFSTSVLSQNVKENSENWQVTSAWIKEITPKEQVHAIFSAFSALNNKTAELIQYRQDWEQILWVAKISACGALMLAKISTKNADLEDYLRNFSDLYVSFILDEIPDNKFADREDQLQRDRIILFSKINYNSYNETITKFKNRVLDTNRSLVVYSMMCASHKEK